MVNDYRPEPQAVQDPRAGIIPVVSPAENTDTIPVFARNPVTSFTFYDRSNFVAREEGYSSGFPAGFLEKGKNLARQEHSLLLSRLKPGEKVESSLPGSDFVLIVVLSSVLIFTLVSSTSRNLFPQAIRFMFLRGISESARKDSRTLFKWQSTLLNLAAFMILSLFCYSAAYTYGAIPSGIKGISIWLLILAAIIAAVSLRHLVCLATGYLSSRREEFSEYIMAIYYSYRFSAVIITVFVLLMNFTFFLPPEHYIIPGIAVFIAMYIVRVIRLILIFMNQGVSIFYLILYLCALEFLPVAISVKYFTGLV